MQSTRYFFPILMKLEVPQYSFENYSNTKCDENPFGGSRIVPCGRKNRHDEANSRFSAILQTRLSTFNEFVQSLSQFICRKDDGFEYTCGEPGNPAASMTKSCGGIIGQPASVILSLHLAVYVNPCLISINFASKHGFREPFRKLHSRNTLYLLEM